MARLARVVVPHFPHHVVQRGNRRQRTFFNDRDYRLYIALVSEFAKRSETDIWAYCLMPNHVHFVMVPSTEDGLRATLGEAHRRYTRHINLRHDWRGHLWQERFHSFPMDEQYLLTAVRYVENNPVAANLCESPENWSWSSAGAHLKQKDDALVRVQPMLDRISDWNQYLTRSGSEIALDRIRKHARTGRPLGSLAFVQRLESITGKVLVPNKARRKPDRRKK